jgi:hypothetical protein
MMGFGLSSMLVYFFVDWTVLIDCGILRGPHLKSVEKKFITKITQLNYNHYAAKFFFNLSILGILLHVLLLRHILLLLAIAQVIYCCVTKI